MQQEKQFYAFISYKREDEKMAKWLQHKLEYYKFPTNLNGCTDLPKKIRPTFRDVTNLTPGLLEKKIHEALISSQWLIVICSPRSAKSQWVCKEAQTFIDLGRADRIIPFVIEGVPFSKDEATECYPDALLNLIDDKELLAANIKEQGKDAAFVKVVATMFGLEFNSLWQPYKREERKKIIIKSCLGILFFLLLTISSLLGVKFFNNNVVEFCKNGIGQFDGLYDTQRKLMNYQRLSFLLSKESRSVLKQTIFKVDYSYNISLNPIIHSYPIRTGINGQLKWSDDESRILVGTGFAETTGIIDLENGEFSLLGYSANSLDYLHGQDTIIVCGQGTAIFANNKKVCEFDISGHSMKLNHNANLFVVAKYDTLTTYHVNDGKKIANRYFDKGILCFDFCKSGEYIAVSTSDSTLSLIKAATGDLVYERKLEMPIVALAPSQNDCSFFVADSIKVCEISFDNEASDSLLFEVPNSPKSNYHRLLFAKGEVLAYADGNFIVVQNLRTKEFLILDATHYFCANFDAFALSPSGTKLAYSVNGKVYIQLIKSTKERNFYPIQYYGFSNVTGISNAKLYSNDSTILMSVVHNDSLATVGQYNLYSGKQLSDVIRSSKPIFNILPLPNKNHTAIALHDENCWKIFDFATAKPIRKLTMGNKTLGAHDNLMLTVNKKYLIGQYVDKTNIIGRDSRAIWSVVDYGIVDSTYYLNGPLQDGASLYKDHYICTYPHVDTLFRVGFQIPSEGIEIFDGDKMAFISYGLLQIFDMKSGEYKGVNFKPFTVGNSENYKLLGFKYGYALLLNVTYPHLLVLSVEKNEPLFQHFSNPQETITSASFFNQTKRMMFTTNSAIYVVDLVDVNTICDVWREKLNF